jgi:hypothetical protein
MRPLRSGSGLFTTAAVLVVAAATIAVLRPPAGADTGAAVSTDPTGAHVELRRHTTWVEVRPRGSGPPPACLRRWELAAGAFFLRTSPVAGDLHTTPMDPAPGPEFQPYHVFCGADYVTSVWLRPQQFGLDPRDLAERLVRDLPSPPAAVGVSPAGRGLTGLESWFWVEGYSGAPIVDRVTELGLTVEVEAAPVSVGWDFGDGTVVAGGPLGARPPARSSVVHTYERRAHPSYEVRAIVRLDVRWRLDGGPWEALDPIGRTATVDYPVVESRAALVPDGP